MLDTKNELEDDKLSDEQTLGHVIDFLTLGFRTTASVLSHVSYMLALHTEIQKKVQAEIDKYFKKRPVSVVYITMYPTGFVTTQKHAIGRRSSIILWEWKWHNNWANIS